jgi:hypothetical protein
MTEHLIVPMNLIVLDESAQPRVTMDFGMVEEFAADMLRGDAFPPLDVFFDGEVYWLADGFHRYHAATAIGMTEIVCRVDDGDLDDAVWFSLQANRSNGVRRTRQDVQNAVRRAITHRRGISQADQWIGAYVGCDGKTVNAQRQLLIAKSEIPTSPSRVDRNGVERVAPQPRAAAPEPAAKKREVDPDQIDLEDYPGVKQPQPITYIDRSNDWIHNELKAAVAALRKLPDPQTTVDRYPHSLGYTLPVKDMEAILDWFAEFVPLWAERFPEFQAYLDKMTRIGEEYAREHAD